MNATPQSTMRLALVLCLVWLSAALAAQEWWKTAIFYQIYPRSFKDSDNDGVGDIKGITSKIDYLAEIGVSAVWLSPIYKSPMADFGYDISNFTAIDPLFGVMDDLVELIQALKDRGLRIILDFVPNHSSDEHPWFNMSVNRQGNYSDYYVWRNQNGSDPLHPIAPNNWQSNFSGSAWEWNEVRQQFYLHQFIVKQPDLNYRNPSLVQDMQNAFKFWLDLGIDGFRMDAVKFLIEDDRFLDEPLINQNDSLYYNNLDHIYTTNQNMTHTIIDEFSAIINQMNQEDGKERVLLLEVYDPIDLVMPYYGGNAAPFALPFNFHLLEGISEGMTALDLLNNINDWLDKMPENGTANWVVGNHDNKRIANRAGFQMVDSMNMILAMLPGIMITYYGDEFGMTDTFMRYDETVDVSGITLGPDHYLEGSRDPERTPLQWDDSENAGFCTNKTWLPVNSNYYELNVEAQKAAPRSHLNVYKSLVKIRQSTTFLSNTTAYEITAPVNNTLIIKRWSDEGQTYVLIVNFASREVTTVYSLPNVTQMVVSVSSVNSIYSPGDTVLLSNGVTLRPKASVILQTTSASTTLVFSLTLLFLSLYTLLLS